MPNLNKILDKNSVKFLAFIIYKARKLFPGLTAELTQEDLAEFAAAFPLQTVTVMCEQNGEKLVLRLVDQRGGVLLVPKVQEEKDRITEARMEALRIAGDLDQFGEVKDCNAAIRVLRTLGRET